jgi:hypothetical protein
MKRDLEADAESGPLELPDRTILLEGIDRGEAAINDGRTLTHVQAKARMAQWLDSAA